MFYSETDIERGDWPRRGFGERVRDALDHALAMLTLEDDYDVDWGLPEDFELEMQARRPRFTPSRQTGPQRPDRRPRRPGTVEARPQPCLSPVKARVPGPWHQARSR